MQQFIISWPVTPPTALVGKELMAFVEKDNLEKRNRISKWAKNKNFVLLDSSPRTFPILFATCDDEAYESFSDAFCDFTVTFDKPLKRSPLHDIFGKWPGNETDEQIREALEDLS